MFNPIICLILYIISNFLSYPTKDVKWSNFNTKTAYRNSKLHEYSDGNLELSQCELVHVNTVFRHGTRNPSSKDIRKINELFKKLNESRFRLHLPTELLNWQQSFSTQDDKLLGLVGKEEMFNMGQRFRNKFDFIPGKQLTVNAINVFSTTQSRSKMSGIFFLNGLFRNDSKIPYEEIIKFDDKHLRYFDNCDLYTKSVVNNSSMKYEYIEFLKSSNMQGIIDSIYKKWQIKDVALTPDDISILYVMCGMEIANNISSKPKNRSCSSFNFLCSDCADANKWSETSPLCSLFAKDHFLVLDYLHDLKNYWIKAYGKPIIAQMSCRLLAPIFHQIRSAMKSHERKFNKTYVSNETKDEYTRGVFWFSHAETILPLIARLKLFDQKLPMTADKYKDRLEMMKDKNNRFSIFRTTNIAPFAANLGLELYHCPHYLKGSYSGYRIQVKVNEKAVQWSMANGTSHIPIEDFSKNMELCLPDKFDFDKVCENPRN